MSFSDALAQTGSTRAAFGREDQPGKTVQGSIVSADMIQQRNFDTGNPETWDDGNPKQLVAITLQTELREDAEDDGKRSVYVKWWGDQRQNLAAAVKAAGDSDLRAGGLFLAQYTGTGEQVGKLNPPKLYTYRYQMPAQTAGLGLDGSTVNTGAGEVHAPAPVAAPPAFTQPAAAPAMDNGWPPAAPAPAAAPAPQPIDPELKQEFVNQTTPAAAPAPVAAPEQPAPAAPAGPAAGVVDQVKAMLGLPLNDDQIAGACSTTAEVVAAIRNMPA